MTARRLTLAILAAIALALILRDRLGVRAADTDPTTWGAADPTWSPDGKRLAFTLFGSIWSVAAEGGEAEQITTSAGYHAHPAWSPKGDAIAFISGNAPGGTLPNIFGTLAVVDPATGRDRTIGTPQPTAGTPSWSPDGSRIVVGLAMPNAGSLLHEIQLSGGAAQIQNRPQRGPAGGWMPTAWSADGTEIYFVNSRGTVPQVWSTPADRPAIRVQLPLTPYRPGDIAQLHGVAASPSGDVIYSAVVVNGKGDHELYRVPRRGGKPVPVTATTRDEFSPAVSPDGKRIALVSNERGNLDLFTMPASGGAQQHVRISGLKFRAPSGRVRVKTVDEKGQPTPARVYVRASDGKSYAPAGSPIFYYQLDPGQPREGFYIGSGEDEFPAPAGMVRLVALKGVEHRPIERTVAVPAGGIANVTLDLAHWADWSHRGWATGENHFHANYNGSYYQRPRDSLAWLEAEDLNTANMIVANAEGAFIHDKEFFRGGVDPVSKPAYVLYWGQEYRNSDPLGHMAFLNVKKQVPPSYTSVIGSNSPYDFPLNTMAAMEARRQGGVVVYVHPIGGAGVDVFDTNLGAKEGPVTAALGAMDAIDILPFGDAAYEMWYRFLNAGFRMSPGAGTDVFTNWRGINNIPGGSRQYVHVGGAMNWDRWIARYREGRAFVTNGPLVDFEVNGERPGAVVPIPAGQPYKAKVTADILSRVPLRLVELIQNGRVVDSFPLNNQTQFRYEREVTVTGSAWLALRVSGPPARGVVGNNPRAHSAAVYLNAGGKPTLVREDVELMIRWIERLWAYLEERNNMGAAVNRIRARAMIDQALAHYRAKLKLL